MTSEIDILLEIEKHKEKISKLMEELHKVKKRKRIKCPKCEKRTRIDKVTVLREYHYVRPSGCTDGDYWDFSYKYEWACEKCDTWNVVFWGKSYQDEPPANYKFVHNHLPEFGEVLDHYGELQIEEIRKNNASRPHNYYA